MTCFAADGANVVGYLCVIFSARIREVKGYCFRGCLEDISLKPPGPAQLSRQGHVWPLDSMQFVLSIAITFPFPLFINQNRPSHPRPTNHCPNLLRPAMSLILSPFDYFLAIILHSAQGNEYFSLSIS